MGLASAGQACSVSGQTQHDNRLDRGHLIGGFNTTFPNVCADHEVKANPGMSGGYLTSTYQRVSTTGDRPLAMLTLRFTVVWKRLVQNRTYILSLRLHEARSCLATEPPLDVPSAWVNASKRKSHTFSG